VRTLNTSDITLIQDEVSKELAARIERNRLGRGQAFGFEFLPELVSHIVLIIVVSLTSRALYDVLQRKVLGSLNKRRADKLSGEMIGAELQNSGQIDETCLREMKRELVHLGITEGQIQDLYERIKHRLRLTTVVEIDNNTGKVRIVMEHQPGLAQPMEAVTGREEREQQDNSHVAGMLRGLNEIVLSKCRIVGSYFRYDPKIRNTLRDCAERIWNPLIVKTDGLENFLIWAAPGSGKTYLIQQIAAHLKSNMCLDYIECNVANIERQAYAETLKRVLRDNQTPVLCLLDEVDADARASESWPYEECLPVLYHNKNSQKRIVFVLIGSTPNSMDSMVQAMERRQKGKDLLSRVPINNRFVIPPATLEDAATMVVAQIVPKVQAVDKNALLYVLCNKEYRTSPRQLSECVRKAAKRLKEGEGRLRYYHLFDPGDNEAFRFQNANEKLFEEFSDLTVQVSP